MNEKTERNDDLLYDNTLLENAIKNLENNYGQPAIRDLILAFKTRIQQDGRLLIPVTEPLDTPESMFDVDKMSLSNLLGDSEEPLFAEPRKVELYRGGEAYSAFTSKEEMDKGEPTKFTTTSISEFLEQALEDDEVVGIVLNPWDVSVLLDRKLIEMVLAAPENRSHIYTQLGSLPDFAGEAVVVPSMTRPGPIDGVSDDLFAKAGEEVEEECRSMPGLRQGESRVSDSGNLECSWIVHMFCPLYTGSEEDSQAMRSCVRSALDLAFLKGIHSIAFPIIHQAPFDFPLEEALRLEMDEITRYLSENGQVPMDVVINCADEKEYEVCSRIIGEKQKEQAE